MQDSSNFNAPPPSWIWSALWSDAKIRTISICYNRHVHCSWKFQLNTTTQCKEIHPSKASKQGHVFEIHCSEEEKKALQDVLCPFTTTLFSSFLKASNSYLKCTTDCIFIELKLTRVCDWLIHPATTLLCDPIYCSLSCALLCDPIYCGLLALCCAIQSTAAFLCFLVWSNLLSPSCAFLCDPIYCCLLVRLIQATAAFFHFLVCPKFTFIFMKLLIYLGLIEFSKHPKLLLPFVCIIISF
jgi:hypothetical protein